MPEVSVIIPNYNHEKYLIKRIESVLNQSYQDFELILLDDCSTDNSRSIIDLYRGNAKVTQIVYNEQNSGTTFKQWLKGLQLAKGNYVWIAESDDYATPDFLCRLMKPLQSDNNVVISYCRSLDVDENNDIIGLNLHADVLDGLKWTKDYIEEGNVEIDNFLKYRNTIPNASAVVFKKPEHFEHLIRTDMRFCGDWFFWQELLKGKNKKIAYISDKMNFFRTHLNSTRAFADKLNKDLELRRFNEYKSFVPRFLFNPFEIRYRWMLAEWIDRREPELFKNTRYQYLPNLHPALAVRYYFYLVKKTLLNKKTELNLLNKHANV